jgi:hypothetical protein
MWRYPYLPHAVATDLATARASLPINDLAALSQTEHPSAIYAPTGWPRVGRQLLRELQKELRDAAAAAGYPEVFREPRRGSFDAASGRILHQLMEIAPSEAAREGVWAFMSCVLLPDLVRWRFPGEAGKSTTLERFLGGVRGLRNAFGRVWWRAELLQHTANDSPYELLERLGEDELVQIMERPSLAGSRRLARQVGVSFLDAAVRNPATSRSDLMRESMKRLRRLLPFVSFDALDEKVLCQTLDALFADTVRALEPQPASHSLRR